MDLQVGTHIDLQYISDKFEGQGHRSKVKVTKVKKCKNSSFQPSIRKYGPRSRSQRSRSKVVGQGQMSQRSRSTVVGQGHKFKVKGRKSRSNVTKVKVGCRSRSQGKVKVIWGVFFPPSTRGRFDTRAFWILNPLAS